MSGTFLFDHTTGTAPRRRFGPIKTDERPTEVRTLRLELSRLRQENDELAGQVPDRSLESLIDGLNRETLERNGQRVRANLNRMSEIYRRLEELRLLGFV